MKKLFLLASILVLGLQGHDYIRVKNKNDLFNLLTSGYDCITNVDQLAIVYINEDRDKKLKKINPDLYYQLDDMKNIFINASKAQGEVKFITAFLKKEEIDSLLKELCFDDLERLNYEPIFILFKAGKIALTYEECLPMAYTGFLSRYELNNFILDNLSQEIKNIRLIRINFALNQSILDGVEKEISSLRAELAGIKSELVPTLQKIRNSANFKYVK